MIYTCFRCCCCCWFVFHRMKRNRFDNEVGRNERLLEPYCVTQLVVSHVSQKYCRLPLKVVLTSKSYEVEMSKSKSKWKSLGMATFLPSSGGMATGVSSRLVELTAFKGKGQRSSVIWRMPTVVSVLTYLLVIFGPHVLPKAAKYGVELIWVSLE